HGFLAFSEIHPDYYRIPVSDRPAGEAEPPGENGHDRDNGGDDSFVPLAAALPEPVAVPQIAAAEDEATLEDEDVRRDEDAPGHQGGGDRRDSDAADAGPTVADKADVGWVYAPGMEPPSTAVEFVELAHRSDEDAPVAGTAPL